MMRFSYEDIDMYDRDMTLFKDGNWLNDSCISFGFKLMMAKNVNCANVFYLMDASVMSFMMLQADTDDLIDLKSSLQLDSKVWLGVPVNDNNGFSDASTHWSFLLCHIPTGSMLHFDSLGSKNHYPSMRIAQKLYVLLGTR